MSGKGTVASRYNRTITIILQLCRLDQRRPYQLQLIIARDSDRRKSGILAWFSVAQNPQGNEKIDSKMQITYSSTDCRVLE